MTSDQDGGLLDDLDGWETFRSEDHGGLLGAVEAAASEHYSEESSEWHRDDDLAARLVDFVPASSLYDVEASERLPYRIPLDGDD